MAVSFIAFVAFASLLLPPTLATPSPTNFRVGSRAGGSAHGPPEQQHLQAASPSQDHPCPPSTLLSPASVVSLERELTLDTTGAKDLSRATAVSVKRALTKDTAVA